MEKMGEILDHLIDRWNLKRTLREQGVFAVWDRCVGEVNATHAQPVSIKHGQLLVMVSDPAWMHSLHLLKDDIKKKLNHGLGRGVVGEIRFQIGKVKPKEKPGCKPINSRPVLLEAGVQKAIEAAVAEIKNEEVRESVRRYLMASARPDQNSR